MFKKQNRGRKINISDDATFINEVGKRTSYLALISMVFGFLGISAFIISSSYEFSSGIEMSALISGIAMVLAAFGLVGIYRKPLKGIIYILMAVLLSLPSVSFMTVATICVHQRTEFEKKYTAKYNMKILDKAISIYVKHHNGYLPDANNWGDELMKFAPNLSKDNFRHPEIKDAVIAFNENLSGKKLEDLPEDIVLFFVAYGSWNLSGGEELFNKRYNELNAMEYTDEDVEEKPVFPDVMLLDGKIVYYWFGKGYRDYSLAEFKPLRWKP